MALPASKVFKQDLPPAGGFQRPPTFTGFRKHSYARGPAGYIMIGGMTAVMVYNLYRLVNDIDERNYYNVSRFNERFERAYVLQSREEVRWLRRQKELLDGERKLMAARPDWVIGKRRFFLQWEDKPDIDCLEPRKIGPFF